MINYLVRIEIPNTPKYEFCLNHKVTVLKSKNGSTGKSYISELIEYILDTGNYKYISCKADFFDGNSNIQDILESTADVIFIDEEVRGKRNYKVPLFSDIQLIKNVYKIKPLVILITRTKFPGIYHSAQQVYDLYLDKTDNTRKLKPRYDISKANSKTYREILTEDSGSGMRYFLRNNIPIDDYKGAGDIINKIKKTMNIKVN